jgi:hypothetical protein
LALTVPKIRKLLGALLFWSPITRKMVLAWSRWRRRHQQTAKQCHYRARLAEQ